MPIDARYLLGMVVAFTMFQFGPKIGHGFKAATVKVGHKLHHHKPSGAMLDVVCYGNLNIEPDEFKRACPHGDADGTMLDEVTYGTVHPIGGVNLPVPDPNSRRNPLGQ